MKQRVFLVFVLIIEVYLTFQFTVRIVSILQTDSRIQNTRYQRDLLKAEFEQKNSAYIYVKTDLYAEEIAREKLLYATPDETVYIVNRKQNALPLLPDVELTEEATLYSWGEILKWYSLFFK